MQNDYEVLLSISHAGHGQFVTMLIKLESHGIFSLNFAHVYILRLSSAYQIKVNNKRNQGKCRSKQSDLTEFSFFSSDLVLHCLPMAYTTDDRLIRIGLIYCSTKV